jgi:nuclear cap-binding protein subunit 2
MTTTATIDRRLMSLLLPPLRVPEVLHLQSDNNDKKIYWDRSYYDSHDKQLIALSKSCTLYVGNLNFTTHSIQVRQHFSIIGTVLKIIMGIDRYKKIPCGFCFVIYMQRQHALNAVSLLSGTKLDGSIIRVELDAGFQNGRQFGRGQSGGQVRHERKAAAAAIQAVATNTTTTYNSGDKRSRPNMTNTTSTGSTTTSSELNRPPRMDDALPTSRKQQLDNADTNGDGSELNNNKSVDEMTTITTNDNDIDLEPSTKRQKT